MRNCGPLGSYAITSVQALRCAAKWRTCPAMVPTRKLRVSCLISGSVGGLGLNYRPRKMEVTISVGLACLPRCSRVEIQLPSQFHLYFAASMMDDGRTLGMRDGRVGPRTDWEFIAHKMS
jgi:hypothetical protein